MILNPIFKSVLSLFIFVVITLDNYNMNCGLSVLIFAWTNSKSIQPWTLLKRGRRAIKIQLYGSLQRETVQILLFRWRLTNTRVLCILIILKSLVVTLMRIVTFLCFYCCYSMYISRNFKTIFNRVRWTIIQHYEGTNRRMWCAVVTFYLRVWCRIVDQTETFKMEDRYPIENLDISRKVVDYSLE